MADII